MLDKSDDTYQKKVIMPNLLRLVDPKTGKKILEIGCGQGYFSLAFAENGASVIGTDISPELIELAKKNSETKKVQPSSLEFKVAPSDSLRFIPNDSMDVITIVLALQNIEKIHETLAEASRILKSTGKLFLVLNHPAFRIPQNSSWQWDEANHKQFRRIDSYMSDQVNRIDMTPGEKLADKKKFTVSFHRPLQTYFKSLNKAGLKVARLEEWISHKVSEKGPRSAEEDRVRKEIPLFMCLECQK